MKFIYQTISEQMETSDWEVIKSALHRAIENLPEVQQKVVIYYYYDGLKVKEIAKILDRPAAYVHRYISKAIVNLRRQLNPSYYKRTLEIMYGPDFEFPQWGTSN